MWIYQITKGWTKINLSTGGVICRKACSLHVKADMMPHSPPRGLSPLLELFGGDEPGPQVAVSHTLGLPPRGVVLGHDLQDVSPLEGKSCFLARCRFVFQRDVVKQGSHVHLQAPKYTYMTLDFLL